MYIQSGLTLTNKTITLKLTQNTCIHLASYYYTYTYIYRYIHTFSFPHLHLYTQLIHSLSLIKLAYIPLTHTSLSTAHFYSLIHHSSFTPWPFLHFKFIHTSIYSAIHPLTHLFFSIRCFKRIISLFLAVCFVFRT